MIAKTLALFALVAAAQAGGVAYVDQHVGAQSEQTIRGLGYAGLSTLSSQSKAVDSALSSVRRYETRVHNPAVAAVAAPVAYAHAPAAYAAPALHAAPVSYAAHAAPVAYAAAPAVARVAAPSVTGVARVAAPVAYAA
ncbi:unnamed protein product, partial [Allacma fusca]